MTIKQLDHLPHGWVEAPLGDIADIGAGGPAPQGEEHFSPDGRLFVRVQDLGRLGSQVWILETADRVNERGVQASRLKPIPAGSVLFTKSGMSTLLNQRAILASESYVVSHIGYATPEPGILSRWLYWALKRIDFGPLAHATTLPSLKLSKVQEVRIRVAPTPEQGRIVAEIEKQFTRLEAAVGALKRIQSNLKRYRAAVLKAAVEGRLVPTEAELARAEGRSYEPADQLLQRILTERRARWETDQLAKFRASGKEPRDQGWKSNYKEPTTPDESDLLTLPAGWTWATLSQLSEIQGGIQKQPSRRPAQNPHPFLRVANVLRGRLDLSEVHEIELFKGELEKLQLEAGDLLIVEGNGSPSEIGRMAIWKGEIENCVHQNHIIRARLLGAIPPAYVAAYWNSPEGASRVLDVASSTSGLYTLSVSKVGRLPVPLPPVAEQHRIVAEVERRLSIIDEQEMQVEANLKRAERLRQAILKRAFEGKLVPQDPDDEPASVLLERIRGTATPGCAEKLGKADTGKSAGATATPGCAGKKIKKKAQARVPVPQQQKQ